MKVAVVILNWNGKEFLSKFLSTVIANSGNTEIVIADNCSTDDSVAYIREHYKEIRIIETQENLGYAGGYNFALSKIDADYFVLLNSDIEIRSEWIEPVINQMEADKMIAACQPKIMSYYESEKFEYAGAAGGYIDKLGYPFCQGRLFQHIETDKGQYENVKEIFWASGACMFIRKDLFWKAGGFDEDFFAHMEEIDLCWRLKSLGYKIMYVPMSKVYHVGGGTLPKSSSRKTYLNFRNNISLVYKNLPTGKFLRVFFIRLILDGIAGLKFLLEGDYKDCLAVIKAHFYFYSHYQMLRAKKKGIVISKNVGCIYKGSIVWDYYFKGKRIIEM